MSERPPVIGILTSGEGTTAEALIRATVPGEDGLGPIIDASVGLVVCSRPPERAGYTAE